jgi:hypothetical protein
MNKVFLSFNFYEIYYLKILNCKNYKDFNTVGIGQKQFLPKLIGLIRFYKFKAITKA